MSTGLVISGGCLVVSGGCLVLGPCERNTDPCLAGCCQWLGATALTHGASWAETVDNFTASGETAAQVVAQHQCNQATVPIDGTVTRDGSGFWVWQVNPAAWGFMAGTITSASSTSDCPPLSELHTAWAHNETTLSMQSVICLDPPDPLINPDTTSNLLVANLIGNFQASDPGVITPTIPIWDALLEWREDLGAWWPTDFDVFTGKVAVRMRDGTYAEMVVTFSTRSSLSLPVPFYQLGMEGETGVGLSFSRYNGNWYDQLRLFVAEGMDNGPMNVTVGYAP